MMAPETRLQRRRRRGIREAQPTLAPPRTQPRRAPPPFLPILLLLALIISAAPFVLIPHALKFACMALGVNPERPILDVGLRQWRRRRAHARIPRINVDSPLGPPLGLMADLQYADKAPGYAKDGMRRYHRTALESIASARRAWRDAGASTVILVGDLIDRSTHPLLGGVDGGPERAYAEVAGRFGAQPISHVHGCVGNHDVQVLDRSTLDAAWAHHNAKEGESGGGWGRRGGGGGRWYYAADAPGGDGGLRLIFLDALEVSVHYRDATHPMRQRAQRILAGGRDDAMPSGASSLPRRFIRAGGGVSDAQLAWLDAALVAASARGQKAVVFSHIAASPLACSWRCRGLTYRFARRNRGPDANCACLIWNYGEWKV